MTKWHLKRLSTSLTVLTRRPFVARSSIPVLERVLADDHRSASTVRTTLRRRLDLLPFSLTAALPLVEGVGRLWEVTEYKSPTSERFRMKSYVEDDTEYGEYEDEEMRPSYLLGCIVLIIGSITLWSLIISLLRLLF